MNTSAASKHIAQLALIFVVFAPATWSDDALPSLPSLRAVVSNCLEQIKIDLAALSDKHPVLNGIKDQQIEDGGLGCSKFLADEFSGRLTPRGLIENITAHGITVPEAPTEIESLNELLSGSPLPQRFKHIRLPTETRYLVGYALLSEDERIRLNRLFLEAAFPDKCPKNHVLGHDIINQLLSFNRDVAEVDGQTRVGDDGIMLRVSIPAHSEFWKTKKCWYPDVRGRARSMGYYLKLGKNNRHLQEVIDVTVKKNLERFCKVAELDIDPLTQPLTQEKRNELAMFVAKTLLLRQTPGGITPAPNKSSVNERWFYHMSLEYGESFPIALLRSMAKQRYITTPDVIPYLIEGVKHPDIRIFNPCLSTLILLTQHNSSFGDKERRDGASAWWKWWTYDWWLNWRMGASQQEVYDWWDNWWKQNKDTHPIFDRELENRTRHELWLILKVIGEHLKPQFPELRDFSPEPKIPEMNLYTMDKDGVIRFPSDYAVFTFDYDPEKWVSRSANLYWPDDIHIRLIIHAGFRTQDLQPLTRKLLYGESEDDDQARKIKRYPEAKVFSKLLSGTDIVIEVKVGTPNKGLRNALRTSLNQLSSPAKEDPLMSYLLVSCVAVVVVVVILYISRRRNRFRQ